MHTSASVAGSLGISIVKDTNVGARLDLRLKGQPSIWRQRVGTSCIILGCIVTCWLNHAPIIFGIALTHTRVHTRTHTVLPDLNF